MVLLERHSDSRAGRLHRRRLGLFYRLGWLRRRLLDAGGLAILGRRRGCFSISAGPAVRSLAGRGRRAPLPRPVSCRSLGGMTCEFVFESADYRRLDCRGRGPDKLTHLLELGHHGLALDAELLSELVYPDLRHYSPFTRPGRTGPASRARQGVLRPASVSAVHRRMLIGRSSQIQPSFLSPSLWLRAGYVLRDFARRQGCREAKGSRERLTTLGSFQACQAWVQVCTPARLPRGDVRNNLVSCCHQADHVMFSRARPAPDAGPDRRSTCAVQLTGPRPGRRPARLLARRPGLAHLSAHSSVLPR
jgi:hypothetical protein